MANRETARKILSKNLRIGIPHYNIPNLYISFLTYFFRVTTLFGYAAAHAPQGFQEWYPPEASRDTGRRPMLAEIRTQQ